MDRNEALELVNTEPTFRAFSRSAMCRLCGALVQQDVPTDNVGRGPMVDQHAQCHRALATLLQGPADGSEPG